MDRKRELELFFGEVEERLGTLEENFLLLEQQGPQPDLIQRLFSAAHNIKGVSGIVGFSELGKLAHSMEDVLSEVRKGDLQITPPLVDALLSAKDSLKNLVSAFAQGAPIPEFQPSVDQLNLFLGKETGQAGPGKSREDLLRDLSDKLGPHGGEDTLRMAISLDPESPLLEIRLMQVRQALEDVGTLLATVPEELGGGHEVCLALKTDRPKEEIEETVKRVLDVQEVSVIPWAETPPRAPSSSPDMPPHLTSPLRGEAGGGIAEEHSLRVPIEVLDRLSHDAGEIFACFSQIKKVMASLKGKRITGIGSDLVTGEEILERLQLAVDQLQHDTLEARFVPLSTLFFQFPRMVRKLGQDLGKKVSLEIGGGDTRLDGRVVEKIKEPLTHILRNCLDHGLEEPEERLKAGKEENGTIRLSASSQAGAVEITVSDDGRGIQVDRIAETAVMRGLVTRAVAKQLSPEQVLAFLFAPGFSTRLEATELSGRGVGLDVVKRNLEEIRGTCRLETAPGKGSRFILQVPATLLIQQLLFFNACKQPFAVPLSQVVGIYEVPEQEILSVLERKGVQIENETLTVFRLERALGLPENGNQGNGKVLMLVVRSLEGKVALVIDEIVEEADRIIKSLPPVLGEVPYIFGVTLNDLGEAVLVFHTPRLASSLIRPERAVRAASEEAPLKRKAPEILVADDSQLIRDVLREILETEGYKVQLAVDGQDALERAEAFPFDLVVTDVEMPRMSGFDLLTNLRQRDAYRRTPILIVSARDTDQDKRRGLELGATAYIGKSKLQKKEFTSLLQSILGSEIYT